VEVFGSSPAFGKIASQTDSAAQTTDIVTGIMGQVRDFALALSLYAKLNTTIRAGMYEHNARQARWLDGCPSPPLPIEAAVCRGGAPYRSNVHVIRKTLARGQAMLFFV
jgi:hypothetical protein